MRLCSGHPVHFYDGPQVFKEDPDVRDLNLLDTVLLKTGNIPCLLQIAQGAHRNSSTRRRRKGRNTR
jgi:hypothetical protein